MGNIHNNPSVTTETNNYIAKSSYDKTQAKFRKSKVSIFKKIISYLSEKFGISFKKKISVDIKDRKITTQKPQNNSSLHINNSKQQQTKIPNDSEGAFEYWDATQTQQSATNEYYENKLGLTKIPYVTDEPIYEDPQHLRKLNNYQDATNKTSDGTKEPIFEDPQHLIKLNNSQDATNKTSDGTKEPIFEDPQHLIKLNNSQDAANKTSDTTKEPTGISLDSLSTINKDMKSLESHLKKIESSDFEEPSLSKETSTKFEEINKKSPIFNLKLGNIFKADDKYNDIPCPVHSTATTGYIYHANKIDLTYGGYVAAQGPYTGSPSPGAERRGARANTAENFIALLAENESAVSVSLVKYNEFGITANNQLPPTEIGETLEIAEIKSEDKIIRKKTTIKKLNSIYDPDMKLQTDVFSINGKTHIRVYDLDWEDKTGGNAARLSAISVFVEKLRNLPELEDRKDKPVTVNCNAGVGRTGTFIMINNMTRRYLEGSGTHNTQDIINDVTHARENRPKMVQKAEQLETIKTVSKNVEDFFDPIAEKLNIAHESIFDR